MSRRQFRFTFSRRDLYIFTPKSNLHKWCPPRSTNTVRKSCSLYCFHHKKFNFTSKGYIKSPTSPSLHSSSSYVACIPDCAAVSFAVCPARCTLAPLPPAVTHTATRATLECDDLPGWELLFPSLPRTGRGPNLHRGQQSLK